MCLECADRTLRINDVFRSDKSYVYNTEIEIPLLFVASLSIWGSRQLNREHTRNATAKRTVTSFVRRIVLKGHSVRIVGRRVCHADQVGAHSQAVFGTDSQAELWTLPNRCGLCDRVNLLQRK